jgi:hypothetical protein
MIKEYFRHNGEVYSELEYEMIDPDEHKDIFLKYHIDPAVQEEELYPYDDYTYPFRATIEE